MSQSDYCRECRDLGQLIEEVLRLSLTPCFEDEELITKLKKYLLSVRPLLHEYTPELKFDYKDLKSTLENLST